MLDLISEFPDLDIKHLNEISYAGKSILESESYLLGKNYNHHDNVSVFEHSIKVCDRCLYYADKYAKKVNRKELIIAALLHDYFKYDWHIKGNGGPKHAWGHAKLASINALNDFNISKREASAIKSHMWPMGAYIPRTVESWILYQADKDCAFKECFKNGKFKW